MKNRIISIVLILVIAVSMLAFAGCGSEKVTDETTTQPIESVSFQETTAENTVPNEEQTSAVPSESEAVAVTETTIAVNAAEMTTEEIIELFNSSANKIKTNASKVVKNYEKRTVNKDKVVMPKALESSAESMIASLMKDDTDPIVYATREEITENYLVPAQSYVSKMKASDVTEAKCEDDGREYVVTFRLENEKNPTAGSGVGSVCDVIETFEVAEKAPFVEAFTTEYYNCIVKAKIDKATGNVVWANYTTPVVLNITVNMFGTHDVSVGFTFEKDYTITY